MISLYFILMVTVKKMFHHLTHNIWDDSVLYKKNPYFIKLKDKTL